jgi:hypothetical protein
MFGIPVGYDRDCWLRISRRSQTETRFWREMSAGAPIYRRWCGIGNGLYEFVTNVSNFQSFNANMGHRMEFVMPSYNNMLSRE